MEEGAFYVWTIDELKYIIHDDFTLFSEVFNINEFGLWEHGNYVLIQNKSLDDIAEKNSISIDELRQKKEKLGTNSLQNKRKKTKTPLGRQMHHLMECHFVKRICGLLQSFRK
ncbi:hypothetical protein [Flavobacterium piscinae]|uniref:hypothetical protein n=1 Tax=Flavobacterium piscinae TaxID=2506424 RepID=UPI002AABA52F|nr:hypothetical protein [Flavobacterium piscinae]